MKNIYGEEARLLKFSGKILREYREQEHKTQKEIASLIGIDYQQYQRWEYGDSCPSADNLMLIGQVLDVGISCFFDFAD